ncbi:MAG: 1-acyl-sn-glycerol-3-phosphate acyltransferase [Acidobacteriota bacterium]
MRSFLRHLRGFGRALVLAVTTGLFYALWASLTPLFASRPQTAYRWRNFHFRNWARVAGRILGIRIQQKGFPPQAPFFLVCNHLSYLDIVVLAARLDSIFISKSDVAGWPVLGLLTRSMGTLYVNRNSRSDVVRVNALVDRTLAAGRGVLLFPEGTSSAGSEVLPFHSALLEPAIRSSYPVSYATLSYRTAAGDPPAHLSVCWWGEMTFLSHFYRLLQLRSIEADLTFGSHSIRADNRKVLAASLHQAVQGEFTPVIGVNQPCKVTSH